jgi:hypothetical protein
MACTCPNCDADIGEERTHLDAALCCCGQCGALWPLAGRAAMPRTPIEGRDYRLAFDGARAQLDYAIRAGTAGAVVGRVLLVMGIIGLLVDIGILYAFIRNSGDFGLLPVLFPVSLGSLAVISLGLYALYGKGRLTMDAHTARLRRDLWGIGWERRCRLTPDSCCIYSSTPAFRAGNSTAPASPQSLFPMSIDTLDGPLNFGFAIPPAERPAVAAALNAFLDAQLLPPDAFTIPRGAPTLHPACPQCARIVGPAAVDVPAASINCPFCKTHSPLTLESTRPATPQQDEREGLTPVPRPPNTKILSERPDPKRLLLYLPPHGLRGNSLGLFLFGLVWSLITIVFGVVAVIATFTQEGGLVALLPLLFLLPFWAVGGGFLYFSLRGAYARKFLYIETDRLLLRTIFAGRTKDEHAPRPPQARAELVVAYRHNNVPVYRLQLGDRIKFGTELDSAEKAWLLYEINRFLAELESAPP